MSGRSGERAAREPAVRTSRAGGRETAADRSRPGASLPVTTGLLLAALLLAACGGSRSGGPRPLPDDDPAVSGDAVPVAYVVECQTCTVSWLTEEGLKTRSAAGSWRREVEAPPGEPLRLVVERDEDRPTSVEARILVRGETVAFDQLAYRDYRDRISLRARAR